MDKKHAVDMSPEAIDQRLRDVGQLYRLWLSFQDIRILGRAEDSKARRELQGQPESDFEQTTAAFSKVRKRYRETLKKLPE